MRKLFFFLCNFYFCLSNPAEFVIKTSELSDIVTGELSQLFNPYGLALPYDILITPSNLMYSMAQTDLEFNSIQDLDPERFLEPFVNSVASLLAFEDEDFRDELIYWYREGLIVASDILYPLAYNLASETPDGGDDD